MWHVALWPCFRVSNEWQGCCKLGELNVVEIITARASEWNNWWEKWGGWEENCEWYDSWHSAEPKRPQQWKQDQKLCIATFIFMAGTSVETCFSNIRSVAIPIETATCSSRRRIKGRENIGKKEFKTIEGTDITYT